MHVSEFAASKHIIACKPLWLHGHQLVQAVKTWPKAGGANGSIRFQPEIGHAANAGKLTARHGTIPHVALEVVDIATDRSSLGCIMRLLQPVHFPPIPAQSGVAQMCMARSTCSTHLHTEFQYYAVNILEGVCAQTMGGQALCTHAARLQVASSVYNLAHPASFAACIIYSSAHWLHAC